VAAVAYWTGATVAFLAELAALAALALGGAALPLGTAGRVVCAVALPVVAAVLWGLFAAPRARVRVPALAVVTKVLVLGGAVAALLAVGRPLAAVLLAAAALGGEALTARRPAGAPPAP
jgi:hypothetical protein